MGLKSHFKIVFFLVFALIIASCSSTQIDVEKEGDAFKSYTYIKRLYTNEVFDKAIEESQKFKAKHKYSKYFSELDLIVAESYLKSGEYIEAAASFRRFAQFYPKHPKRAYALFKVGDTYWQQAPEAIDREQSFAKKAMEAWQEMLKIYPESTVAAKARKLIKEGELRLLKSDLFVTRFYCKQKVWHACAHKGVESLKHENKDKATEKELLEKSALAFRKLSELKSSQMTDQDSNLYFRDMSMAQLKKKAEDLQIRADKIKL